MPMTPASRKPVSPPRRRRYVVHLFCEPGGEHQTIRYIARIHPWSARRVSAAESRERTFADDCELIATINPLLPSGSDVRNVFEHIEGPNGFFYLLRLSSEEAGKLGWRTQMIAGDHG